MFLLAHRTLQSLRSRRSGLSTVDLARLQQNEALAQCRLRSQERRAVLPLDLVGAPVASHSPLGEEELEMLRSLLLVRLAGHELSRRKWEQREHTYKGVRITDPFLPREGLEHIPVQERFDVQGGLLRHVTLQGSRFYEDPDDQLENWALTQLLSHAHAEAYHALRGTKPF